MKQSRYIDILTDFGFKLVFGSEPNKDLLIHFLNELFKGHKHIQDIEYFKNEFQGSGESEGGVIFDLLCTGKDGERFLLEVQRAKQEFFIQRAVAYTSRLISEQIPRGKRKEWRYDIDEVYMIAILETFTTAKTDDKRYIRRINLCDRETMDVFYEGFGFIFIELCNFAKKENELSSDLDNWLYVLKNMSRLDKIPVFLRKSIFQKLFQITEYSNLTKEEKVMYDFSNFHKWDNANALDYAIKEGRKKGREEGIAIGVGKGADLTIEIMKLVIGTNFSNNEIAKRLETDIKLVMKVRNSLKE